MIRYDDFLHFVTIYYGSDDCYETEGDAYAGTDEKRWKNFVKSQFENWARFLMSSDDKNQKNVYGNQTMKLMMIEMIIKTMMIIEMMMIMMMIKGS